MPPLEGCQLCKRCNFRKEIIGGDGFDGADVMVVLDAPTREDEYRGHLVSGSMGDLLRSITAEAGIEESRLYISSAVRCYSGKAPVKAELDACRPFLQEDIKQVRPAVIVTMGSGSLTSVLGKTKGVMALRGSVAELVLDDFSCAVVPTFAPGIIYKDPGKREVLVSDLRKAVLAVQGMSESTTTEAFIARTIDDVYAIRDALLDSEEFSFDFETTGLNYLAEETVDHVRAQVLCASFSNQAGYGMVIPLVGEYLAELWDADEYAEVVRVLKEILESEVPKVASNGKFDCLWALNVLGIQVFNFAFDTQLSYAMIHEERPHNLEHMRTLFTQMVRYESFKDSDEYKALLPKWGFACYPQEELWQYAAADADTEFRIAQALRPLIAAESVGAGGAFAA